MLDGVSKSFGGIHAVSNVSLELVKGQIASLIGPNGSGKSTLLNLITGFLSPDSGAIRLGDTSLLRKSPHAIARLGICRTFQDLRLIKSMSILDNLRLANVNEHRARACLEMVGLSGNEAACAGDLSYGQQKLLTIACCLAVDGDYMLFDEPVAGVHPGLIEQIAVIIRKLQVAGKSVVLIEHDLDFVKSISDRVFVMAEGTIIADGSPSKVLGQRQVIEAYLQ